MEAMTQEKAPKPRKIRTTREIRRAQILAERRLKLQLNRYVPKAKSISGRIAELLHWAFENYPGEIITNEEITQAIFTLGKLPISTSQQVVNVRGRMSDARQTLRKKYNQDLISEPGVGARASTGSVDVLTLSMPKATANYERAANKLQETANLISNKEVTEAIAELADPQEKEELLGLQAWYQELVQKVVKRVTQPQFQRLLPPPDTSLVGKK